MSSSYVLVCFAEVGETHIDVEVSRGNISGVSRESKRTISPRRSQRQTQRRMCLAVFMTCSYTLSIHPHGRNVHDLTASILTNEDEARSLANSAPLRGSQTSKSNTCSSSETSDYGSGEASDGRQQDPRYQAPRSDDKLEFSHSSDSDSVFEFEEIGVTSCDPEKTVGEEGAKLGYRVARARERECEREREARTDDLRVK